jgi:hypothetical protein
MSVPSEPSPDPALKRRVARPWDRPETEFPASVPVGILPFDRSESSAVAVTSMLAYSNGFEFFVTRLLRPDGPGFDSRPWPPPPGGPAVRQSFEGGLEVADGRQVFGQVPPSNDEPGGPIVRFGGGIGSSHREDSRWWARPLPPAGRLGFICRLGGIETRASLDAQLILDASQRSVRVWPNA